MQFKPQRTGPDKEVEAATEFGRSATLFDASNDQYLQEVRYEGLRPALRVTALTMMKQDSFSTNNLQLLYKITQRTGHTYNHITR